MNLLQRQANTMLLTLTELTTTSFPTLTLMGMSILTYQTGCGERPEVPTPAAHAEGIYFKKHRVLMMTEPDLHEF